MKQFKINEKEYSILENWNEIELEPYIKICDLYEKYPDIIKADDLDKQIFMTKFLPLISSITEDELTNMYDEDIEQFKEYILHFKVSDFIPMECRYFTFNNTKYCTVIPSRLTTGENISIKILEKGATSKLDNILSVLTICVRPCIESINEFGEVEYEALPLKSDPILLNKRKELLKKLPAVNALFILEAFTAGKKALK